MTLYADVGTATTLNGYDVPPYHCDGGSMRFLPLLLLLVSATSAAGASLRDASAPSEIAKRAGESRRLRVVNIWATWCIPCVDELPDLERLHSTFSRRGVEFVGVSLDHSSPGDRQAIRAKVTKFLVQTKATFPNLYYTGRLADLAEWFDFSGEIPATLIYDANGNERGRVRGRIDPKKFGAMLDRLLAERPTRAKS